MYTLVTGGLGFIGSHTVVELIGAGRDVIIVDDLYNSSIEVLDKIEKITGKRPIYFQYDCTDEAKMEEIFKGHDIEGVIHFAGYKAVGESVSKPLMYYRNNLLSTIVLADLCVKYKVAKFVFSSSATVYGDQEAPFSEDMPTGKTTNPYGTTKLFCEQILTDAAIANPGFNVTLLRYFNPIGAHASGLLGEDPNGIPNNLMPYIVKVASGEFDHLSVFGDDYDTVDGTGVRDYIHVVDLAKGHLSALDNMKNGVNIYNLGTGKGTSVLELVNAFIKENKVDVKYEISARRPGDIATCYANSDKALKEIGWKAEKTVEDMVKDSWNFAKKGL